MGDFPKPLTDLTCQRPASGFERRASGGRTGFRRLPYEAGRIYPCSLLILNVSLAIRRGLDLNSKHVPLLIAGGLEQELDERPAGFTLIDGELSFRQAADQKGFDELLTALESSSAVASK